MLQRLMERKEVNLLPSSILSLKQTQLVSLEESIGGRHREVTNLLVPSPPLSFIIQNLS